MYTVKKVSEFTVPSRQLFPARESSVSDIPAGDGKSLTFFHSVGPMDKFVVPSFSAALPHPAAGESIRRRGR
jgi:hypothetical protein